MTKFHQSWKKLTVRILLGRSVIFMNSISNMNNFCQPKIFQLNNFTFHPFKDCFILESLYLCLGVPPLELLEPAPLAPFWFIAEDVEAAAAAAAAADDQNSWPAVDNPVIKDSC